MRKLANRFGQGFTLIELMIVVAIIGILAAIAIPNFIKFQCRSKQSEAKSQLKSMYVAQESYFAEFQTYVTGSAAEFGVAPSTGAPCGVNAIGWHPKGENTRYAYTANGTTSTLTETADAATAAASCGNVDASLDNDRWQLDQDLVISHPQNGCD